MKKNFKSLFLFGMIALALVLAAEATLRAVLPYEKKRIRYMRTRNVFQYIDGNVRFDEKLGFITSPNMEARFRNEEFDTMVLTNSIGFRDDEASLDEPEILLLGDSVGFGWGVEKEDACESVLETLSGRKTLNMSVPGYGTAQEFLLLRGWGRSHELKNKIAIFLLYPNDILYENMGFGFGVYPKIDIQNGEIHFSGVNEDNFKDWFNACDGNMYGGITRISYLAYSCERLRLKAGEKISNILKERRWNASAEKPNENWSDEYRTFGLIVNEIKTFADREKFTLLFVYCPSVLYYENRLEINDTAIVRDIEPIFRDASIPLIDLRDSLTRDDYYRYDEHWRPSGHYKAALRINRFLREKQAI